PQSPLTTSLLGTLRRRRSPWASARFQDVNSSHHNATPADSSMLHAHPAQRCRAGPSLPEPAGTAAATHLPTPRPLLRLGGGVIQFGADTFEEGLEIVSQRPDRRADGHHQHRRDDRIFQGRHALLILPEPHQLLFHFVLQAYASLHDYPAGAIPCGAAPHHPGTAGISTRAAAGRRTHRPPPPRHRTQSARPRAAPAAGENAGTSGAAASATAPARRSTARTPHRAAPR